MSAALGSHLQCSHTILREEGKENGPFDSFAPPLKNPYMTSNDQLFQCFANVGVTCPIHIVVTTHRTATAYKLSIIVKVAHSIALLIYISVKVSVVVQWYFTLFSAE